MCPSRGKSSEAATRGNIGDMTKYVPNGDVVKNYKTMALISL
jgi:hypothetical protein